MTVHSPEIMITDSWTFARATSNYFGDQGNNNTVLEEIREQWKNSLHAIKGQSYSRSANRSNTLLDNEVQGWRSSPGGGHPTPVRWISTVA